LLQARDEKSSKFSSPDGAKCTKILSSKPTLGGVVHQTNDNVITSRYDGRKTNNSGD